jgi:hypothetical protein
MFRLEIGAEADVVRAGHAEHVEEARRKDVEAEGRQPVRVDLVVGGDAVGVVHHQDAGVRALSLGIRRVARDPILFLREQARDDH